jgi:predicted anti-sigma-YlaC factor YlaD
MLGAYALGVLDERESSSVEEHLISCPPCRREAEELRDVVATFAAVPPEALIDGPPAGGDLLLQRTLRQVRAERGRQHRARWAATAAAVVLVGLVGFGGGMLFGRGLVVRPEAASRPSASSLPSQSATVPVPGTRLGSVTDPATGARMSVAVQPAAGWVQLDVSVAGVPAGTQCRLVVMARDGSRREAGSWLVSAAGAAQGTHLHGSAMVAPNQVTAVEVDTFQGARLVSVPV